MERVRDLLEPINTNLQIKEDKIKGIYIAKAKEVYVSSKEEVF